MTLDGFIQKYNPKMVVGAVRYENRNGFLHHFQQLDFASLQSTTIGSFEIDKPFMCNGANLAYAKSLFLDVNGFLGNDNFASGDDVFLLQKVLKHCPKNIFYLKSKNHIVTTQSVDSWSGLLQQRIR